MYNIIENIISHDWIMQGASEQQYIYYICGSLIVLLTMTFIDLIYRIFSHFWNGRR